MNHQSGNPLGWVVLSIFLFAFAAEGLENRDSSPWYARVWQADEGLPGDNVTAVAQTVNHYLWIATHNGLARFDGSRFELISLPLPVGRLRPIIRAMVLDGKGNLWLAEEGAVAVCLSTLTTNVVSVYTSTNGLLNYRPLSIVETPDQAVWISYVDGSACRIADGQVKRFTARDGLQGTGFCRLALDAAGQLWFFKSGRLGVYREGQFVTLLELQDRRLKLAPARDGGVWICADAKLYKYKPDAPPVELGLLSGDAVKAEPTALFEDRTGALWIGTAGQGLFRFDGTNVVKAETSHGDIASVVADYEGNIWVGTIGGGLDRLRQRVVELASNGVGLPSETASSICEDASGKIWAVLQDGSLVRRTAGTWKTLGGGDNWTGSPATCVAAGKTDVWVGTYRNGLYHFQNGDFSLVRRADGLAGDSIRSLLVDSEGNLWIGFETGGIVQRYKEGRFESFLQPPGSHPVRTMAQDAAGKVWMATSDGFLLRAGPNGLEDKTAALLKSTKPIRALQATPDGSLWIGFAGLGVGRLRNGQVAAISEGQGLADANICAVQPDGRGSIWFASDHGIFLVSQRELDQVADGTAASVHSVTFGRADGVPSLQANYGYAPGSALATDGSVWFVTHSGIVVAHPDRLAPNRIPPPVLIENFFVDGRLVSLAPRAVKFTLSPAHRQIDIQFTAPTYLAPERVRFRYWLEGWDDGWTDAGDQHHAVYSRLPAGEYYFHVTARNAAGVENPIAASMLFVVQPFVWQTWPFRLGALAGFTALVVGVVRYISFRRLRLRLRLLEQETALQRERARIAQDIHDDLGASLTQIKLLGELTDHDLAAPEQAREHVEKISATARASIKSLDEIVWAVNPQNDTLAHLLDYIGQFAVEFLRTANLRCRVDFPQSPPARMVSAELRHNLFLAVKESLNNIVKHAQAREVWIRFKLYADKSELVIEDDGRGLQAPTDAWPNGLRNMRKRLESSGGAYRMKSAPGQGTKIYLELPRSNG
jgi:signal transduction histidine kinase/ligand-binding sensor domain-containing protein